jgi:hypothetical protein
MKKTILSFVLGLISLSVSAQKPSPALLTPTNHALVLIDHESRWLLQQRVLQLKN